MPMYDYRCKKCEHHFEEMHIIAERKAPEKKACPECGKKQIEQTIEGMPFIGDPVRQGTKRVDNGFREVMQKVADNHPNHTMNRR